MNEKASKELRRTLRRMNLDPKDSRYEDVHEVWKVATVGGVIYRYPAHTSILTPSCGRAIYRRLKAKVQERWHSA